MRGTPTMIALGRWLRARAWLQALREERRKAHCDCDFPDHCKIDDWRWTLDEQIRDAWRIKRNAMRMLDRSATRIGLVP